MSSESDNEFAGSGFSFAPSVTQEHLRAALPSHLACAAHTITVLITTVKSKGTCQTLACYIKQLHRVVTPWGKICLLTKVTTSIHITIFFILCAIISRVLHWNYIFSLVVTRGWLIKITNKTILYSVQTVDSSQLCWMHLLHVYQGWPCPKISICPSG